MKKQKVVFIGNSGTGKSSILAQMLSKTFSENPSSTIGVAYSVLHLADNIELQLWDTAGQERYRSFVPFYMRGCNIILLVYDVTNPNMKDIKYWANFVSNESARLYLIGNKSDLIPQEVLDNIVTQVKSHFKNETHITTSAKLRTGIEELKNDIKEYVKSLEIIDEPEQPVSNILQVKESMIDNDKKYCCSNF